MQIKFVQKLIDKIRGKNKKGKVVHDIESVQRWFKDDGDNTLRVNYNLDSNSVVFDAGGYIGDFADKIFGEYQSNIYVFEPVKKFHEKIVERFQNENKIKAFNIGLSDKTEDMLIQIDNDASSVYTQDAAASENIKLVDIKEFIDEHNIQSIDLFKINTEGGEYPLLERLIEIDWVKNIDNIQVQFHNLDKKSKKRMQAIQKQLSKTHKLTYQYAWCWENWQKK